MKLERKPRILVVEDEKLLRWSISQELTKRGYRVVIVASGEEAVRLLESEQFDVVITDLKLEGMDGLEVASAAKRRIPTAKVLVISAYGSPETRARARSCGVFRFLSKPVDGKLLASVIEEATSTSD
ncbi:MAG: response regulator [Candidatus Eiseniibacteriota bacterium]|nr:MAG: response regulator [Candidatus Eisenbacteria bacterium]